MNPLLKMKNLLLEYNTSLQIVSYRTSIPLYKLENFIYKKFHPIDNVELHKFLHGEFLFKS